MRTAIFIIIVISAAVLSFILFARPDDEASVPVVKDDVAPTVTLKTSLGDIKFITYPADAPQAVANFINLADGDFYDGLIFHRVIDGFMIQGGDPIGTGFGGPGYTFVDEINPLSELYRDGYKKGIVAMANAGPNTNGSQFFIMVANTPLPPSYTIFGRVIEGQEVADAISRRPRDENDKPFEPVVIREVIVED